MDFGNGNVSVHPSKKSRNEFLSGSASLKTAAQVGRELYDFDEPIILHQRRLDEPSSPTTYSDPEGNSRGMMFWITPRKKP
ncbi:MAG: hypothetical protein AAF483_19245 [Planctomycetota bacterium]